MTMAQVESFLVRTASQVLQVSEDKLANNKQESLFDYGLNSLFCYSVAQSYFFKLWYCPQQALSLSIQGLNLQLRNSIQATMQSTIAKSDIKRHNSCWKSTLHAPKKTLSNAIPQSMIQEQRMVT